MLYLTCCKNYKDETIPREVALYNISWNEYDPSKDRAVDFVFANAMPAPTSNTIASEEYLKLFHGNILVDKGWLVVDEEIISFHSVYWFSDRAVADVTITWVDDREDWSAIVLFRSSADEHDSLPLGGMVYAPFPPNEDDMMMTFSENIAWLTDRLAALLSTIRL